VKLEPYLTLGALRLKTRGFTERGGVTALRASPQENGNAYSQLGLRAWAPLGERAALGFEAGWSHMYGRLESEKRFQFQGGADGFPIRGLSPNRDEAVFALSLEFRISESAAFTLSYDGQLGSRGGAHAGSALFGLSWE
jgi:outer membrane autotransporter protein